MTTNATTWQLLQWTDDEPNSRWDIIDSDRIDEPTTAAEALGNILASIPERTRYPHCTRFVGTAVNVFCANCGRPAADHEGQNR